MKRFAELVYSVFCFFFWFVVHVSLFYLQCIGKVGKIGKIDADGDVHINYGLQSWVFHPDAVTKVSIYKFIA